MIFLIIILSYPISWYLRNKIESLTDPVAKTKGFNWRLLIYVPFWNMIFYSIILTTVIYFNYDRKG